MDSKYQLFSLLWWFAITWANSLPAAPVKSFFLYSLFLYTYPYYFSTTLLPIFLQVLLLLFFIPLS